MDTKAVHISNAEASVDTLPTWRHQKGSAEKVVMGVQTLVKEYNI